MTRTTFYYTRLEDDDNHCAALLCHTGRQNKAPKGIARALVAASANFMHDDFHDFAHQRPKPNRTAVYS